MNLNEMTDEEFYSFLKEKYGDMWMLVTLTPEEFDRLPRLTDEEITALLKQGYQEKLELESRLSLPLIPNIFYR